MKVVSAFISPAGVSVNVCDDGSWWFYSSANKWEVWKPSPPPPESPLTTAAKVPEELGPITKTGDASLDWPEQNFRNGWNACRAAMLNPTKEG